MNRAYHEIYWHGDLHMLREVVRRAEATDLRTRRPWAWWLALFEGRFDDLDAIVAQWAPENFEAGSGLTLPRSMFTANNAWLRGDRDSARSAAAEARRDFERQLAGRKDADRFAFVQRGCLMMILAMAWDMICGSGCYLERHMDRCERALATLTPKDPTTEKLVSVVRSALVAAKLERHTEELHAESGWAYHNVVRLYFKERAGSNDA